MKFYKFLITAACIAIAAVCIALIVRVNRAFPNAEEVRYTKDNPADLDGLEITPVNAKVYTLEDYSKISGQYKNVSEEKAKNVRIIVMTVRLRNTTDRLLIMHQASYALLRSLTEAMVSSRLVIQ